MFAGNLHYYTWDNIAYFVFFAVLFGLTLRPAFSSWWKLGKRSRLSPKGERKSSLPPGAKIELSFAYSKDSRRKAWEVYQLATQHTLHRWSRYLMGKGGTLAFLLSAPLTFVGFQIYNDVLTILGGGIFLFSSLLLVSRWFYKRRVLSRLKPSNRVTQIVIVDQGIDQTFGDNTTRIPWESIDLTIVSDKGLGLVANNRLIGFLPRDKFSHPRDYLDAICLCRDNTPQHADVNWS